MKKTAKRAKKTAKRSKPVATKTTTVKAKSKLVLPQEVLDAIETHGHWPWEEKDCGDNEKCLEKVAMIAYKAGIKDTLAVIEKTIIHRTQVKQ